MGATVPAVGTTVRNTMFGRAQRFLCSITFFLVQFYGRILKKNPNTVDVRAVLSTPFKILKW
jgi:hypothetical protein